jgi:ubiquitin carboxyl-terminal hydrolase 5/13
VKKRKRKKRKGKRFEYDHFFPDFAEPLTMPGYGGAASSGASVFGATGLDNQPPEEIVAIITSMGFQRNQAVQALRATVSM